MDVAITDERRLFRTWKEDGDRQGLLYLEAKKKTEREILMFKIVRETVKNGKDIRSRVRMNKKRQKWHCCGCSEVQ